MEEEIISIIVPVYKVPESYLRTCIESILKQTYQALEIFLVDDGSPDSCGAICDEYAGKDSRIQVIHKQNGGLSAARNTGAKAATGKWLMFVDGDDWIDADMCQIMLTEAVRQDCQIVLCGMVKEYTHNSVPYSYYIPEKKYSGQECRWLQEQLLHFNGNIATAYCKLIRRDVLEMHQIYHDEFLRQGAEGLEFNLRLFEKIETAVFISRPLYHYIYNDNSISASHNEKNHEYVIQCFEKIRHYLETSNNKNALLEWFDNRLLYVIITTAISGYFSPSNPEPYRVKKEKYKKYLEKPIVHSALQTKNLQELSMQRKLILWLIKHRQFWMLALLAEIRKRQKQAA